MPGTIFYEIIIPQTYKLKVNRVKMRETKGKRECDSEHVCVCVCVCTRVCEREKREYGGQQKKRTR